jgi:outer membrane protein
MCSSLFSLFKIQWFKQSGALILLVSTFISPSVFALDYPLREGHFMFKMGAVRVDPDAESGAPYSESIPGDLSPMAEGVKVDDDQNVGFSFTYMITDRLAFEVPLGFSFNHNITVEGGLLSGLEIGSSDNLPISLSMLYYLYNEPSEPLKIYGGLGYGYAYYTDTHINPALGAYIGTLLGAPPGSMGDAELDIENDGGPTYKLGASYFFTERFFLDASVMFFDHSTTASIELSTGDVIKVDADMDPWIYGVNVGVTF